VQPLPCKVTRSFSVFGAMIHWTVAKSTVIAGQLHHAGEDRRARSGWSCWPQVEPHEAHRARRRALQDACRSPACLRLFKAETVDRGAVYQVRRNRRGFVIAGCGRAWRPRLRMKPKARAWDRGGDGRVAFFVKPRGKADRGFGRLIPARGL